MRTETRALVTLAACRRGGLLPRKIAASALLLALALNSGCTMTKRFDAFGPEGEAIAVEFKSGLGATGGDVTVTFADGRSLAGRWTQTKGRANLTSIFISTPNGPVTA